MKLTPNLTLCSIPAETDQGGKRSQKRHICLSGSVAAVCHKRCHSLSHLSVTSVGRICRPSWSGLWRPDVTTLTTPNLPGGEHDSLIFSAWTFGRVAKAICGWVCALVFEGALFRLGFSRATKRTTTCLCIVGHTQVCNEWLWCRGSSNVF